MDVIAEILTYPDYIAFSERLLKSGFAEDMGEKPLLCRWRNHHSPSISIVTSGELAANIFAAKEVPLIQRPIALKF